MTIYVVEMRLTQGKTLANTDHDAASNKNTDVSSRSKSLHEGCDNDEGSASSHSDTSSSVISERTTHEETSNDSANGIRGVDGANDIRTRVVEVRNPMLRILQSVEDGCIVTVQDHA